MTKRCPCCGVYKARSEFYKNRQKPSGISATCKDCTKKRVAERQKNLKGRELEKFRRVQQRYQLKRFYGLSSVDEWILKRAADGKCQGCGEPSSPLHVDHEHIVEGGTYKNRGAGGEVRGLLCFQCNALLGLAKDNPARLRALADYLENPPARNLPIMGRDQLTIEDATG